MRISGRTRSRRRRESRRAPNAACRRRRGLVFVELAALGSMPRPSAIPAPRPESVCRCEPARPSTVRSMPRLENRIDHRHRRRLGDRARALRRIRRRGRARRRRRRPARAAPRRRHDDRSADRGGRRRGALRRGRRQERRRHRPARRGRAGARRRPPRRDRQQRDGRGQALEGPARDERGRLGHHPRRRPARPLPLLPARRAPDADPGAARRGARPRDQHLLPARHGRRARQRAPTRP